MKKKLDVIAIIPARGGSKGIPRKNIVDLCGKPLMAYSIEAALRTPNIDRVVVSTDDEEIADVARAYGAEIPFMRPAELAGCRANIGQAVDYTVRRLQREDTPYFATAVLYPTSPFRNPALLGDLVERLRTGNTQVLTVRKLGNGPFRFFATGDEGTARDLCPANRAQPHPERFYYRPYGLFYGFRGGYTNRYLHVIRNEYELIDIDDVEDLYLAESVIRENLYDFRLGEAC